MSRQALTTDDLLFVSFSGKVFAVDRIDGSIVWKWKAPKSSGAVTLLPDVDRLFVSVNGYTWALDPTNGAEVWHQPFKGEGVGFAMLATMRGGSSSAQALGAAVAQAQAQAAASHSATHVHPH